MVAILRADWDEQPSVWEASQEVTAVLQKENNKTVVTFLHKNVKFSLFFILFPYFKILIIVF